MSLVVQPPDACHFVERFEMPTACGIVYGSSEYNRQRHHIASDWDLVTCVYCREGVHHDQLDLFKDLRREES